MNIWSPIPLIVDVAGGSYESKSMGEEIHSGA